MRIYVACPLTKGDISVNVRNGILSADEIAGFGHTVFVPALTHFWHMMCPHNYEFWMKQDFEWIKVCDALYRVPGESAGADREVEFAKSLGKKIFYDTKEL